MRSRSPPSPAPPPGPRPQPPNRCIITTIITITTIIIITRRLRRPLPRQPPRNKPTGARLPLLRIAQQFSSLGGLLSGELFCPPHGHASGAFADQRKDWLSRFTSRP